jgi:hypothetical protein
MARPKKPGVVGVKIRLAASLVAQLEAAAKKTPGRSFNAECAMRLGRSFGEEEAFGGEAGRRLIHFLAAAFVFAGERYYCDRINPKHKTPPGETLDASLWIDEPEAYDAAMMSVTEQLMLHRQPGVTPEKVRLQLMSLKMTAATHFANKSSRERAVRAKLTKEGGK